MTSIALLRAVVGGATYNGDPTTFKTYLPMLQPGDTLELSAGTYPHFSVNGRHGNAQAWITIITGPTDGGVALVEADPGPCCNTIEISNSSYVAIRHVTIDSKGVIGAFSINASGSNVHHIRIENNRLIFTNAEQQDVGISAKVPTWGWEIRGNRIEAAGTGMYLGNSDGSLPFVQGVIEHNLVVGTVGYNIQIKHQSAWPPNAGLPIEPTRTIIRHNVFIKDGQASPDGDRPNLLLGGWPDTGNGSQNIYEVYGNLFYENPREALFQATGNVSVHDNLLSNRRAPGSPLDLTKVMSDVGALVDFNGVSKGALTHRGAYAGDGADSGWVPAAAIKTIGGAGTGGGSGGVSDGGQATGMRGSGCGCASAPMADAWGLAAFLAAVGVRRRAARRPSKGPETPPSCLHSSRP